MNKGLVRGFTGTPAYTASNPNFSGNQTISAAGSSGAESVIPGMMLSVGTVTPGAIVDITIDLWEAMNQSGAAKASTARLRRDGLGGEVLGSHNFTDAGDSTGGHQQEWSFTLTDRAGSSGIYVVTIQATSNSPQITSDTRVFSLYVH